MMKYVYNLTQNGKEILLELYVKDFQKLKNLIKFMSVWEVIKKNCILKSVEQ